MHPNFSPKRSGYVISLICSILSFLISLIDIIDIGSLTSDTSFASVGGGLYLCVIGSTGALFLSVIGTFKLKMMGKEVLLKYRNLHHHLLKQGRLFS